MNLPININQLLHGKAVEWERLEFKAGAIATRVKNFPYAAIEEAVVNAVYHRDYTLREPIEIRIYEDLTLRTLQKHSKITYEKTNRLHRTLYRLFN